jgi:hypothetical protein
LLTAANVTSMPNRVPGIASNGSTRSLAGAAGLCPRLVDRARQKLGRAYPVPVDLTSTAAAAA